MLNRLGVGFLLASVALQNLGRREARTLLLVAAVFAGEEFVVGHVIHSALPMFFAKVLAQPSVPRLFAG